MVDHWIKCSVSFPYLCFYFPYLCFALCRPRVKTETQLKTHFCFCCWKYDTNWGNASSRSKVTGSHFGPMLLPDWSFVPARLETKARRSLVVISFSPGNWLMNWWVSVEIFLTVMKMKSQIMYCNDSYNSKSYMNNSCIDIYSNIGNNKKCIK